MKKGPIILLYFIFFGQILLAQGGFKKKYYPQNSLTSVCGKAIEIAGGNLIWVGLTYDTLNNKAYNRLTILGSDKNGVVSWRKDYGNPKFEYLDGINKNSIVQDNTAFYLITCVRDSNNRQVGALLKLDLFGDTMWQKIYVDGLGDLMPQGISKSIDNGLLISGCLQNTIAGQPALILKADKSGNELWRKSISKNVPNIQNCFSVCQDTFSKKIIMVGYQAQGTASAWDLSSNILFLDSVGNKISQSSFNNLGGGTFIDLIQLTDNNFLSCGQWAVNSSKFKSRVVKFDINGNIIWQKNFDTTATYNGAGYIHERANGDLIIAGWLDTVLNHGGLEIIKLRLTKMDKFGNILWQKYVGNANSNINSEGIRSLVPTQDNGYLITSAFSYSQAPRPYSIIKIDSTGCDTLESYCKLISGTVEFNSLSDFTFDCFPNPANEKINLKFNTPSEKKYIVAMTDIQGRAIFNIELRAGVSSEMNTSSWPTGLYFLNLLFEGRVVQVKKLVVTH